MNTGRLLLTILVGFVFIFASDFLIHALWLSADYKATAPLWRTEDEMHPRFLWMLSAQLLCAIAFIYIWAKTGWRRRSINDGAVFGFWMGIFQQVTTIVLYVVIPMPGLLALKWFIAGLVQAVVLGALAAAIYKPRSVLAEPAA
ncbi:MAG: hypothetical protein H0U43_02460 [Chthoniobacterales bacterium]|nr:hypothetical protein [Chthoniobacterales bacterium]